MLTDSVVATLTAQSVGFTWPVTGCDRPPAKSPDGRRPRVGMRLWLHGAQGGVCPHCDNAEGALHPLMGSDLSHVVGSGPVRKGWVSRNIYLAHSQCNVKASRAVREGVSAVEGSVTRIMAWLEAEGLTVATVVDGYTLTLAPEDFARPDLVGIEWPCTTTGGFRVFDTVTPVKG